MKLSFDPIEMIKGIRSLDANIIESFRIEHNKSIGYCAYPKDGRLFVANYLSSAGSDFVFKGHYYVLIGDVEDGAGVVSFDWAVTEGSGNEFFIGIHFFFLTTGGHLSTNSLPSTIRQAINEMVFKEVEF